MEKIQEIVTAKKGPSHQYRYVDLDAEVAMNEVIPTVNTRTLIY
jgi:hypothetical protein